MGLILQFAGFSHVCKMETSLLVPYCMILNFKARIVIFDKLFSLTLWCLKYVTSDIDARPMCLNRRRTLVADEPTERMAKDNNKFPARIGVPGMSAWLYQRFSGFRHFPLLHFVFISSKEPICLDETAGLSDLQEGQNANKRSS